ncbi:hypothetical protein CMV_005064 [Castanea mollissima]|uniref:Uncharacterized protein n=1 Tax=Castanea mollissima TaxID=60419 RepID=A0A8J4VUN8_9ROSI|nr:hypothetical protein CMV_005064 [Castanea mollissima]
MEYCCTLCSMEPGIDEEPKIVRPSPEDPSLLTRQRNHRSEDIWNGEDSGSLTCRGCAKEMAKIMMQDNRVIDIIKWVRVPSPKSRPSGTALIHYREQLVRMQPDQIIWQPYEADFGHLPDFCVAGRDTASKSPFICDIGCSCCFHCRQVWERLWYPSSLNFIKNLFHGNESSILAITEGCQLTIWDIQMKENGGCLHRICGSPGDVFYAVCSSSTGNVAVGGADRTVTIFDPRRGTGYILMMWGTCREFCFAFMKSAEVIPTVEGFVAVGTESIPPSSVIKQLAVAVEAGKKLKSLKDCLASSASSSPVRERAGLSLSAVKSLVLREKEEKLTFDYGDNEKVLSLVNSLFDAEGNFLRRKISYDSEATTVTSLPRDIHGAPAESLVVKLAEVIGSFKTLRKMVLFWSRVVVEVNASDNGGKADAKIEKGIGGSNANSIKELVSNEAFSVNMDRSKHPKTVLIMDEVDGMSAGDRGGVADLIASIKISKIPIIGICNDRYSQKLKSLVNYCLLLSFRKPMNQQLLSALYLPFLSSFLTDHSFPLVSALLSFPDIQVAMEKGAPLRSKGKEDKLKGKDDSSTKPKSTRKVQFNFEGSPEYKTSSLPKSLGKDDTPFPKGKGGGKGDKIANGRRSTVSKEPQPLELKVEQDLPENVKCMMDCEALDILQGIQDQLPILSKDPEFRLPVPFDKGLQYAKRGVHYANPQAVRQVLEDLTKYGVSNSEICVIANVCPESDEEVFSLLPSLKTHFWSFWNHIY